MYLFYVYLFAYLILHLCAACKCNHDGRSLVVSCCCFKCKRQAAAAIMLSTQVALDTRTLLGFWVHSNMLVGDSHGTVRTVGLRGATFDKIRQASTQAIKDECYILS